MKRKGFVEPGSRRGFATDWDRGTDRGTEVTGWVTLGESHCSLIIAINGRIRDETGLFWRMTRPYAKSRNPRFQALREMIGMILQATGLNPGSMKERSCEIPGTFITV